MKRVAFESSNEDVVYSSRNELKDMGVFFAELRRDFLASLPIAWALVVRDVKAKYRQSILGYLWAFIPSVVLALGLLVAKTKGIISLGETETPYGLYVFVGVVLWQTFSEAVLNPIRGVKLAAPMLSKQSFPKESILIAKFLETLFNFHIKLVLLVAVLMWYEVGTVASFLYGYLSVLSIVVVGITIGIFLSPLGMVFQDIDYGVGLLLAGLFFVTPVVFVAAASGDIFSQIVDFNPLSRLIEISRGLIVSANVSVSTDFLVINVIAVIFLLLAFMFNRMVWPFVIERLSH